MESVTVKFQEEVLKRMDAQIAKHSFNSRTEFIREAIRDKMELLTREEAIAKFMALRGTLKGRTLLEDDARIREEVGEEMLAEYKRRFSQAPRAASKR